MANTYLAADFGGGSGRVMAGTIENGKLVLEEIHRFQKQTGNNRESSLLGLFSLVSRHERRNEKSRI